MADPTAAFAYLFRGRTDAYGLVHGESVKREVTLDIYREHLAGHFAIGIYPLVKTASGMRVAWGCTDIDDGYEKSWPLARNMQKTLALLDITSWIEVTKGKGYHVWVFVEGWIPAENMRNALLLAHQVAGVSPTEVNPKQTATKDGAVGLGNYVNLPYPLGYQQAGRRVVLEHPDGGWLDVEDFLSAATESINKPEVIAKAAALYVPPPTPKRVQIDGYDGQVDKHLTDKLTGLAFTIFRDGPLDGRDRSGTLMRLAHLMAESGVLTPGEAVALLADADIRYGKFHEQGRPEMIDEMVALAFGKAQGPSTS